MASSAAKKRKGSDSGGGSGAGGDVFVFVVSIESFGCPRFKKVQSLVGLYSEEEDARGTARTVLFETYPILFADWKYSGAFGRKAAKGKKKPGALLLDRMTKSYFKGEKVDFLFTGGDFDERWNVDGSGRIDWSCECTCSADCLEDYFVTVEVEKQVINRSQKGLPDCLPGADDE